MSLEDERSASEVFAIIEEPTTQTGPIRTMLLRFMAPFGGQLIPGSTHPVLVEKGTGKRLKGADAALSVMIEDMQADLDSMTVAEYRNRYFDV